MPLRKVATEVDVFPDVFRIPGSDGSLTEGQDIDKRASAVQRKNTGSPRTFTSRLLSGWCETGSGEIDAMGRRRWEGLWQTARKDARTYSGPGTRWGFFISKASMGATRPVRLGVLAVDANG